MKPFYLTLTSWLLSASFITSLQANTATGNPWTFIKETEIRVAEKSRQIVPTRYVTARLDVTAIQAILNEAPLWFTPEAKSKNIELSLPMPDGTFERFTVQYAPVMAPELAEKYPMIRAYAGRGIDDPTAYLRFDMTQLGFHASVYSAKRGTVVIDPYSAEDIVHYLVYYRMDNPQMQDWECYTEFDLKDKLDENSTPKILTDNCTLRIYRLALACTGEFAQICGGTKSLVMSSFNTIMMRVNGIFEKEANITMNMISNTDELIFLNPNLDPYNNDNINDWLLDQNEFACQVFIGQSYYDIGHVFATGNGGIASVGSVCNSNKERGASGTNGLLPDDRFSVQVVTHEMGHQFGARHTFNACGTNSIHPLSSVEPGSGSTIMGYAGTGSCSLGQYVKEYPEYADDYFHAKSLEQIEGYIQTINCQIEIPLDNIPPTANAGNNYIIPRSTPFALTAQNVEENSANDTYCWEQMDPELVGTPLLSTNTQGPAFRSYLPTTSPRRYFPALPFILNNANVAQWEVLPSVSRNLNFRLTVRDALIFGCPSNDDMVVNITSIAGPFVVTTPNTAVNWPGLSQQTVTWNVANTNALPVLCPNVDILLSVDGGYTYPYTLASQTANDGVQVVTIPNSPTASARIMVRANNNIFFDVSNTNFSISQPGPMCEECPPADLFITTWKTDNPGTTLSNQIRIPGTGSNYTILWEEVGNPTNYGTALGNGTTIVTFPHAGIYRVSIHPGGGTFTRIQFSNHPDSRKLLSIDQWGTISWSSMEGAFYGCENLAYNATDIPNLSAVTSMASMFKFCSSFNGNIGNWNTSAVTDMNSLFEGATIFNQPIGNWNTSAVTNMIGMFANAISFNQPIGSWNTASVTSMGSMFLAALAFNQPVNTWNISSVTNLGHMFYGAAAFNQPIGNLNTASVTNMTEMFIYATTFNQNLGAWVLNSSVNLSGMLDNIGMSCNNYSSTLIGWSNNPDTPNGRNLGAVGRQYGTNAVEARANLVTNKGWTIMGDALGACNTVNPAEAFITIWKTDNPGVSSSNQIRIPGTGSNYTILWEEVANPNNNGTAIGNGTTTVTFPYAGTYRVSIHPGSGNFTQINFNNSGDRSKLLTIDQWGTIPWSSMGTAFYGCNNLNIIATDVPNLNAVTNMSFMFADCGSLNGPINIGSWNTGKITNMSFMFNNATSFNQPIGNWNTAKVTNMSAMFQTAYSFNQPIGNWNTAKVTSMSAMFAHATSFNQPIGNWNTAAVTSMFSMFYRATSFNQPIGNWNTAAVTDMTQMFTSVTSFNQSIGNWNTAKVTNMSGMFSKATSFNQPIGNWNTSAVTDMSFMFSQATSFNQSIGNWNTAAVTNMRAMFQLAYSFNQSIGNWNTAKVTDMGYMFSQATSFNQSIGNWNTSAVTDMSVMFQYAYSFNQPIGNWNTAAVTDMTQMFRFASAFNQNLSNLILNSSVNLTNMLEGSGMACNNYSATLIGWSNNPSTPNSRSLGASGRQYGTNAVTARNYLVSTKGWTISGDAPSGVNCIQNNGPCPAPTIDGATNIGVTSANLRWTSNSTPTDNCWVITVGGSAMTINAANCPDGGQQLFTTTVCYINNVPSFSVPVTGMTVVGNQITISVSGLQPGTMYNWYVSETCDGFPPPNNVSGCTGPGIFQTLQYDAPHTLSANAVPPTCPYASPGYVPNGSFTVTVNNGAACAGIYTVQAVPVPGSGLNGSTPPPLTTNIYIGFPAGTFSFINAGVGQYTVTVTETGPCNPQINPVTITVTVPNGSDNVQPIFYVTDVLGNIIADNDPLTAAGTSRNFGTVQVPEGECGLEEEYYVYGVDNCDGFITANNAVSASAVTIPNTMIPGTQVSVMPDGFGFYLVGIDWSMGTSTVSIFTGDASGNIANNPTGLTLIMAVPDNVDPVISILGNSQFTIPVCATSVTGVIAFQVDDLCNQNEVDFNNLAVNFGGAMAVVNFTGNNYREFLVTFPATGNYLVSASYTDVLGNVGVIDQIITVIAQPDISAPIILYPAQDIIVNLDLCDPSTTIVTFEASATDNCGIDSFNVQIATGSSGAVVLSSGGPSYQVSATPGTYTVLLTATDISGNVRQEDFRIIVNQQPLPMLEITCPGVQTFELNNSCSGVLADYRDLATTNDVCNTHNVAQLPPAGTLISGVGEILVMLTVSDTSGNTNSCSFVVNKADSIFPTAVCSPSALEFNGQTSIVLNSDDFVTASDNCSIQSVILSPDNISCTQIGQVVPVTATVTDIYNNATTCISQVTVSGLPCGWSSDSGSVGGVTSTTNFDPSTGTWDVTGTNGFYGPPYTSDALAFAQLTLCGNGSITARVTGISGGLGWAGVTMRETNDAGAKKVQLMTNLGTLSRREYRTVTNGPATLQQFSSQNRYWLRLTRQGNQFIGHASPNGTDWFLVMTQSITMNACIEIGLVVTNYQQNSTVTATFANVSHTGSGGQALAPPAIPDLLQAAPMTVDFSVFPNPTSGTLNLDLTQYIGLPVHIEVYNLQGKLLHFAEIQEVQTAIESLDLSGLHSGMYLVRVTTREFPVVTKRVVVDGKK